MGYLRTSQIIPAPAPAVYEFLSDLHHLPESLEGLIKVELRAEDEPLERHAEFSMVMTRLKLPAEVTVRVEDLDPDRRLVFRQIQGEVFKEWHHTILLEAHGTDHTLMIEIVDFKPPFGLLGALVDDLWLRKEIERILRYRAERIVQHFELTASALNDLGGE